MKKKKSTVITVIIMILLAVGVVIGYFYVSDRRSKESEERESVQTEIEKLLEKNLNTSYPATPREVVKVYSRMMKCFYNEERTEDQVEQMLVKLRLLYDAELLQENTYNAQLEELWEEIKEYKACKRTIISYQIEKAGDMITWTDEERDYARLIAYYTQKEDTEYLKVYEEFILRKDTEGRWKILSWRLADGEDMEKE